MRIFISTAVLISVLFIAAGCTGSYAASDPIPAKIGRRISDLERRNAQLAEFVPAMVIAVTVLDYQVTEKGSVGEFCQRIEIARPGIEKQKSARLANPDSDPQVSQAIEHMLSEFSAIRQELGCDQLQP